MRIIIMRHGQAVNQAATDALRPLTDKGQHDARAVGQWLVRQLQQAEIASEKEPEIVLVSPYVRAQQTAAQVLAVAPQWPREEADWITPDNVPSQVIRQLAARSESAIMLVSHQPLVSGLLAMLIGEEAASAIAFTPATAVILEGEMIGFGAMQLVASCIPEQLS